MFVCSVKTTKRQVFTVLACFAVLVTAVTVAVFTPSKTKKTAAFPVSLTVETEAERTAFLKALGYEVDAGAVQVQEIRIPDELDETLLAYNRIQAQAGMDLTPYCGKRVRLYTYPVLESGDGDRLQAHLYVYRDTVVAGDISDTTPDGVSQPLAVRS